MNLEALNPTLNKLLRNFILDIKYHSARGLKLYDEQGNEYLDFISQYGSVPFGYNCPEILAAAREFLSSGIPAMIQPSVPVKAVELAEMLIELAPGKMAQATFCQSGAEAVEIAIKLARSTTGKFKIISTDNSFHGKTMGALSATGRKVYQEPFFVPAAGFETIPFDDLAALENKLRSESEDIAAFIVEPVQGEGGIIIPSEGYLKGAELLCRQYGVLYVVDEIQTGLGRTGYLFACEREGVEPDVLLLAKALGGGLVPIGVCLSSKDAWNADFGKLHSSTFANNNFTCAVGIAVLKALISSNKELIRHIRDMGDYLLEGLKKINEIFPGVIKDIRGRGLMAGIEFNKPDGSDSFSFKYLAEQGGFSALLAGFLLHVHHLRCAPFLNNSMTLRLQPSLTVTRSEIDFALNAVESVVKILYYKDYSEIMGYLVDRKPSGTVGDYRNQVKPVTGSELLPGEKPTEKFAFLIHYPAVEDVVKNNVSFHKFSENELKQLLDWEASVDAQPEVLVHMPAIRSKTGKVAEGWLIGVPYSGKHLVEMPRKQAVTYLAEAVDFARGLGARIVGLGAYTSVVSRGGADLLGRGIAITSGNSYTIASAFDALMEGANLMGIDRLKAVGAVIGATGSIGRVCALMLSDKIEQIILVGNPDKGQASLRRLKRLADEIYERRNSLREGSYKRSQIKITLNISDALRMSDLIISASSSISNLIGPENLKPGCIICDVARPADVSRAVLENRSDILVIEGGLVSYPDKICFGQNMGNEPGVNLACLSETVLLALDGADRDFSIGTKISIDEVNYLKELADKHGFKLAKPQNEKGEITSRTIDSIKEVMNKTQNAVSLEVSCGS